MQVRTECEIETDKRTREVRKTVNECAFEMTCGGNVGLEHAKAEMTTGSGVFLDLVNSAAFIDKLVLGVDGKFRKRIHPLITIISNLAIGGSKRPYARSMHGVYKYAEIPFELKYGPNPLYPSLFDTKLILRSEGTPISHAEVSELLGLLYRKDPRSIIQGIEFTFDVSVPLRFFENHLVTRAKSIRCLADEFGRHTVYAGAPGSLWMLRIYQKTEIVTRVEFVFRHSFLADGGINDLRSLGNLKTIPLSLLARFPAVCQRELEDLLKGKATGKQLQLLIGWPHTRPTRILLEVLKDYGLKGNSILRRSPVEQLLHKMQESFIWNVGEVRH